MAREPELIELTLRDWVKAAKQGKNPPGGKAVTLEQMELSRVRAENARLRMESGFFRIVPVYFAKGALSGTSGSTANARSLLCRRYAKRLQSASAAAGPGGETAAQTASGSPMRNC